MSWASNKTILAGVLTDNDYREVPENKLTDNAAMSHNHQVYVLKPIGTGEILEHTSNGIIYNHRVILDVKYKNIDSNERDINYQSFLNLFEAIATLDDYKGTLSQPEFTDLDDKHTKGSFTFLFGEEFECNTD